MPNAIKQKEIQELENLINNNNVFYVTDYRGLTVRQFEDLRNNLRKSEIFIRVAKNRLFLKAWQENQDPAVRKALKNPSAVILSKDDPVMPARLLKEHYKENELPRLKAIIVDGKVYGPEKFEAFANMPSPKELQGIVVGTLAAPITSFVRTLNALPSNLVYAIKAIADKKSEQTT